MAAVWEIDFWEPQMETESSWESLSQKILVVFRVEREVGGGIGMGNTCISVADSCQCMTETTTIL